MRPLTFAGFLKQYTGGLSKFGGGLYKMAHEAATSNARLREPLLLYALYTNKLDALLKATKSKELSRAYAALFDRVSPLDFRSALEHGDKSVPEAYQKVWRSYEATRDAPKRDARVKSLMRTKALRLRSEANVSTYRVCRDLKLNGGNVNAWLKHGDDSKVSLATARQVVSYFESQVNN